MKRKKLKELRTLLFNLSFAFLPSIIFIIVLSGPKTHNLISSPLILNVDKDYVVHSLVPNTKWSHLSTCGEFVKESQEIQTVMNCVKNNQLIGHDKTLSDIPKCFVITHNSPDLRYNSFLKYNYLNYRDKQIAGFYDVRGKTIFLTENQDMPKIYRHEFQHYLLHILTNDDELAESYDHTHIIWKVCEGQFYGE